MPELPEVETIKRELNKVLPGRQIKSAKVLWWKTVLPLSPQEFQKQIKNKTIKALSRRAKIILVDFSDTTALAIHLKMTGQLIFQPKTGAKIVGGHLDKQMSEKQPTKYTRLILEFKDSDKLYFNDLRKFGWVRLIDDRQVNQLFEPYGLEPLSKVFSVKALADIFKRFPSRTIKQILLDQTLIAGLGNIYVDESCFLAKLLPTRKSRELKPAEIKKMRQAIVDVLKLSLRKKGTSSRNYRRADGTPGGFVPYLNVYDRQKEPCKKCRQPIQKITHAGRGTHFCPTCQK